MKYAIVDIVWCKSHGIEVLPEMRTSVDQTKVILHEEFLSPFDNEELSKYESSDPEFMALLASEEWTYPEGEEPSVNREYSRLLALDQLDQEATEKINTYGLTASEALRVKNRHPKWKVGINVNKGDRYQEGDKLYECDLAHKTQEDWRPGQGSHSLWHEVTEEHAGTAEDPIPYNEDHNPLFPGMILEVGKYYKQDNVTYKCIRNSEIALVQDLSALVGHYVEVVKR